MKSNLSVQFEMPLGRRQEGHFFLLTFLQCAKTMQILSGKWHMCTVVSLLANRFISGGLFCQRAAIIFFLGSHGANPEAGYKWIGWT